MASNIFKTLITRQIDLFVGTFGSDSNSLFKNEKNKLFHPGEYGMYKEQAFRSLLQCILPKSKKISDGFIISALDKHSTQCDVLVYDANTLPLTDGGYGKFFPVENIYAIGEIKSNLDFPKFKEALVKLAKNKMMSDERLVSKTSNQYTECTYLDPIPSFLVCNKLRFDLDLIDFDNIYAGIPRKYWHNLILSLEDGLIRYIQVIDDLPDPMKNSWRDQPDLKTIPDIAFQYAQLSYTYNDHSYSYDCPIEIVKVDSHNKYHHILEFLGCLTQAIQLVHEYEFDGIAYLGLGIGDDSP